MLVGQTLDRLIREGIAEGEARRLIGCVVASEIFDILKRGELFDEVCFVNSFGGIHFEPLSAQQKASLGHDAVAGV